MRIASNDLRPGIRLVVRRLRGMLTRINKDHMLHRAVVERFTQHRKALRRCHKYPDVAVVDDVADLRRLEDWIDRNENPARRRCGEDRSDGLDPLLQEDSYSIVTPQSKTL